MAPPQSSYRSPYQEQQDQYSSRSQALSASSSSSSLGSYASWNGSERELIRSNDPYPAAGPSRSSFDRSRSGQHGRTGSTAAVIAGGSSSNMNMYDDAEENVEVLLPVPIAFPSQSHPSPGPSLLSEDDETPTPAHPAPRPAPSPGWSLNRTPSSSSITGLGLGFGNADADITETATNWSERLGSRGYAVGRYARARSESVSSMARSISSGSISETSLGGWEGSEKYSLDPNPQKWNVPLFKTTQGEPEVDDWLHDEAALKDSSRGIWTMRGLVNIGFMVILAMTLIGLFVGYPLADHFVTKTTSIVTAGSFNLGGVNGSGQVPETIGSFGLIDDDTPSSAYTKYGITPGTSTTQEYDLVFSDEFETDGRTFYAGDDPYWTAENLHYWATNNLEWYDPRMITTANGSLVITLNKADPTTNHNLNYTGGLVTSWNKFCFTGGYVETKVRLPGSPKVWGLWPAIWTLGNLGRAGYGATLDGMWPYSYNECDVGTAPNQTINSLPASSLTDGDPSYNYSLSYLPGQRLSRCTCSSDTTHPGPKNSDGTWVGRSAPEIDLFEAQVDSTLATGHLSMSGQWAPFNANYQFTNTSATYSIYNSTTELNGYVGGITQQSTSAIVYADQSAYQYPNGVQGNGTFAVYGFEYKTGSDGYITWLANDVAAWTVQAGAVGPDTTSEISARSIPDEPMYILMNVGISENFGAVDFDGLESLWPVHMYVDYIRVYQPSGSTNIGCDPSDRPTSAYINTYAEAYNNPNITTWAQAGQSFPSNKKVLEGNGESCPS